jgi:copper resistance protein B
VGGLYCWLVFFTACLAFATLPVCAHGDADPLLSKVLFEQLEYREGGNDNAFALDGQAWIGKDLNKFWLKSEAERADGEGGSEWEGEVQALYSRAVAPFWDMQAGLKQDNEPGADRTWAVLGFQGLAPYFIETEASLFVDDSADVALRLKFKHEFHLSQRLILVPELESDFYGQNNPRWQQASGLSDLELGLRLHYEIVREFAPYIGINHQRWFGDARRWRDDRATSELALGVRLWF